MQNLKPQSLTLPRWVLGRHPRRTLRRAALLAIATYLLFGVIMRVTIARGVSMLPTVPDGAVRLADMLRYRLRSPRRGEIVTIRLVGRRTMLLKRVIGLPGEEVRFERGTFLIDGVPLSEPYVVYNGRWTTGAYRLGPAEYYVAGDNRSGPYQDHATGIVKESDILGKLLW